MSTTEPRDPLVTACGDPCPIEEQDQFPADHSTPCKDCGDRAVSPPPLFTQGEPRWREGQAPEPWSGVQGPSPMPALLGDRGARRHPGRRGLVLTPAARRGPRPGSLGASGAGPCVASLFRKHVPSRTFNYLFPPKRCFAAYCVFSSHSVFQWASPLVSEHPCPCFAPLTRPVRALSALTPFPPTS